MCRNIKQLSNFEPPATEQEIQAAALQFVRKISGTVKPSKANEAAFNKAIQEIAHISSHLLASLENECRAKKSGSRSGEAKARSSARFATGN